jgi:hypothetical protein
LKSAMPNINGKQKITNFIIGKYLYIIDKCLYEYMIKIEKIK